MNSPYMGKFQVTQQFKGSAHDGLDLVGIDSKEIHATIDGKVIYAGWENESNHKQGFGQFVCILGTDNNCYYYGHMSQLKTTTGAQVKCTDVIGIEGDTGYSFGSHCHYCIRPKFSAGCFLDVCAISGIPNKLGTYDDGYRPGTNPTPEPTPTPEPEPDPEPTPDPEPSDEPEPIGYGRIVLNDKEYDIKLFEPIDD